MRTLKRFLVSILLILCFIGFALILPVFVYWVITGESYLDIPEDLISWANK